MAKSIKTKKVNVKNKTLKKANKRAVKKAVKKATKKKVLKKAAKKISKTKKVKKAKKVQVQTKNKRKSIRKSIVPKAQSAPVSTNTSFVPHRTRLKIGDKAPFIQGYDQNGNLLDATKYSGFKIALYFYPKDDTPGCTKQACNLRDNIDRLGRLGFKVIGVSADNVESHRKFAYKHKLNFPLIADVNKHMIEAYDVWGMKKLYGRLYEGIVRTTFLIGEDGKIMEVIDNVDVENHHKQIKTSNN